MFLLDGKALSLKEQEQLKNRISNLAIKPSLHVILVGCLAPSEIYVEKKQHAATYVGIQSFVHRFTNETTTEELLKFIHTLNNDASVHAILLQLPLPHHLDSRTIIDAISPLKDVDGLTSSNLGKLMLGSPQIIPCTPQGCLDLIRRCNQNIEGLHAVVVGRSSLVGKPVGQLLLNNNMTVTLAHSKTKNLKEITRQADVLIAAIGSPHYFGCDFIKEGAIVIDVGISRTEDETIVGDVDFNSVKNKVLAISPVPGGVGPMTVTNLLKNTLICYERQKHHA